jgi:hypothetical protein
VVERTGGRFYAAPDEDSILKALAEIDRLSPGKIEVRQYSVQRPRYAGFALIGIASLDDRRGHETRVQLRSGVFRKWP